MKPKAVIFDMDGLIIDTVLLEHQTLEELLKGYKKKPKLNEYGLIQKPHNEGVNKYVDIKANYEIEEDVKTIQDKKRVIFHRRIKERKISPYEGFIALLNLLKKEKFSLAVASNRDEKTINLFMETLGVRNFFDAIVGGKEGRRAKPYPDIYLYTVQVLGVAAKDCVVLEDSQDGINSAAEAGVKIIAIPNIYTNDHDFSKADIIVNSLLDIDINLLESL